MILKILNSRILRNGNQMLQMSNNGNAAVATKKLQKSLLNDLIKTVMGADSNQFEAEDC